MMALAILGFGAAGLILAGIALAIWLDMHVNDE